MDQESLRSPRTALLRIMLAVNVVNAAGWAVYLYVRHAQGLDESPAAYLSSSIGGVLATFGLLLTGRYPNASGWILVVTSIASTLSATLYLDPVSAGYCFFFLSVPIAIAALMLSSRAGIGTFFATSAGVAFVFSVRDDLPIQSTIPPAAFVIYLSAIIIVATYVKELLMRGHEAKLAESAKMASLGQMSAGIAHEINNPLFVLGVSATELEELALQNDLDRSRLIEVTRKVTEMTRHIEQTVTSLRQFAREASNDPMRPTTVRQILDSTKDLCRQRFASEHVQLQIQDASPSLVVACRPVQVAQILVNLLNNALDAVQSTAEPWVRIETIDLGTNIVIAVTDSGPGVPAEIRNRIMNPFFTTKKEGKGTGLGLSLSLAIARDHGGRLYLDPASSVTRFVLELPKNPTGQASWPA